MARATFRQVAARDLVRDQVIIDPDGKEARVIRVRWVSHLECLVATDLNEFRTELDMCFPVKQ